MYSNSLTKPLVCGHFGPHPHAHRTKFVMCGACTRTPYFAPARAPARALAHAHFFKRKFKKKNFFKFFFTTKLSFLQKRRLCRRAAHICTYEGRMHAPAHTFLKVSAHPFAQKSPHSHVCACAHTHAH